MIPMDRVMERLDRYFESNDTAGAKRHLEYWIAEAKQTGDTRSLITLYNEKMGLHRRCGEGDDAIACAKAALAAAEREGISGTVSEGTVMINCATVYTAFGKVDDALPLFAKAADMYESNLGGADPRLGSLYNNMATAFADAKEYVRAEEAYERALAVMKKVPGAEPELAVTKLNLANLLEAAYGMADACERIDQCLTEAHNLLETEGLAHGGHYAFVCDKCAPVFSYYGWFRYAEELSKRAADIYANGGK